MSHETPQQAARRISARQITRGFKPVALHVYCDAKGNSLYWRIRLKHPQTKEKWLRPIHINEQQTFVMGEPDFSAGKPLYRLDQLISNVNETVWVTEGEWCADHLGPGGHHLGRC
jgi:putative DNA primase/helicase